MHAVHTTGAEAREPCLQAKHASIQLDFGACHAPVSSQTVETGPVAVPGFTHGGSRQ